MKPRLQVLLCTPLVALAALSGCNDSMGLEELTFACGPALPCAAGYTCTMDPNLDELACKKDPALPDADVPNIDAIDTDTEPGDTASQDTYQEDTSSDPDVLTDSLEPDTNEIDTHASDVIDPMDVEDVSLTDATVTDTSTSDTCSWCEDATGDDDTGSPVELCNPEVDSLCFSPCDQWSKHTLPPSAIVPGAMFVDMGGTGTMDAIIYSGTGFKIINYEGDVVTQSESPNSSTFARGKPVAVDLTPPDSPTVYAKELSLLMAPAQNASALTWKVGPEAGVKEFIIDQTNVATYDFMQFLAADMDFDGLPEFIAGSGCNPVVDLFTTNPKQYPALGSLVLLDSVETKGVDCDYNAGRLITDLDGDSEFELMVGRGFASKEKTEFWNGNIDIYQVFSVGQNNGQDCPECFNTDMPPLIKSGVTDLFRAGDIIHAVVRYFTVKGPPALGSAYYHWKFNPEGEALGSPTEVDSPKALIPVEISDGHPPVSVLETRTVGLWDVNGDNLPDRITTEGDDLVLELYDSQTGIFVEHKEARITIGKNALVRSIGDRKKDIDDRLDILVAHAGGNVSCVQLGKETFKRESSIPPYESPYYRTNQKDNFEPNDAMPLPNALKGEYRIPWLPTNLTGFGKAWSYLETENDVDFFQVKTALSSEICIRSPIGKYAYEFSVSVMDAPQTPLWESTSVSSTNGEPYTKCVKPSVEPALSPFLSVVEGTNYKSGLFVIRVYSPGPVHPDRPYWIDTPNILAWDGLDGFGG